MISLARVLLHTNYNNYRIIMAILMEIQPLIEVRRKSLCIYRFNDGFSECKVRRLAGSYGFIPRGSAQETTTATCIGI